MKVASGEKLDPGKMERRCVQLRIRPNRRSGVRMGKEGPEATHRSKSNSRGSQTYQATVSGMRLMNSICIVIAKLVDDGLDLCIILRDDQLADNAFEPVERTQCE